MPANHWAVKRCWFGVVDGFQPLDFYSRNILAYRMGTPTDKHPQNRDVKRWGRIAPPRQTVKRSAIYRGLPFLRHYLALSAVGLRPSVVVEFSQGYTSLRPAQPLHILPTRREPDAEFINLIMISLPAARASRGMVRNPDCRSIFRDTCRLCIICDHARDRRDGARTGVYA